MDGPDPQPLTNAIASQIGREVLPIILSTDAPLDAVPSDLHKVARRALALATCHDGCPTSSFSILDRPDSVESFVLLRVSASAGVCWTIDQGQATLSVKLAETILRQIELDRTVEQQTHEIDSLTAQVVNDFEELALLRSLADSIPLLTVDENATGIVTRFIEPLLHGLGAQALVAVLCNDSDESDQASPPRSAVWTGDVLFNNASLFQLVDAHRDTATRQPVVLNQLSIQCDTLDQTIEGLIAIECRSKTKLHGWVFAFNRIEDIAADVSWAQHGFTTVQASLMETATNQLASQLTNAHLFRQKEDLFTDVVRALVNAVEARDPYTCGHSERVASFARCLAGLIGQSTSDCDRIYLTGLLHDVGKIAIPDGVLQKPGQLDDEERAIIETHTDAGWRILHELDALKSVLPGVLYHHEHFNGKGYPDGLMGENIPLEGRILAVCDAFDAMTSNRPYRDGMPIEKACGILSGGAGSYWDPQLIEVFMDNTDAFDEIRIAHNPREVPVRVKPLAPASV